LRQIVPAGAASSAGQACAVDHPIVLALALALAQVGFDLPSDRTAALAAIFVRGIRCSQTGRQRRVVAVIPIVISTNEDGMTIHFFFIISSGCGTRVLAATPTSSIWQ